MQEETGHRRKHSLLHYALSIPRQIWHHPNVRGHRARALTRAVSWQLYSRLIRKPITIRVYGGLRLRCYPQSASASNVMYFGDHYEFHEMVFVRRLLRPGDAFIDGGANIGTYSLLAGGIVGPEGRVDAFEPDPLAAARLRENVALNQLVNTQIHQVALSDVPGRIKFVQGWDVSNRVASLDDGDRDTVEVDAVRLDDVLPPDVRYVMGKLDLEGAELAALRGATDHLRAQNPPVWLFEGFENQLARLGATKEELLSLLTRHGYKHFAFEAIRNELVIVEDPAHGPQNLFAIHSSIEGLVRDRLAGTA